MQKQSRIDHAFTLIELLTVVAIIGVLAGLLFPAIKSALLRAEVTKAQTSISGLETAFKSYYTEYGRWPASTTDPSGIMSTTNWMVALLRGEDKTGVDPVMLNVTYNGNPRHVRFMEFKNQDLIIVPANNVTNFVDPWKIQYRFMFDQTYGGTNLNPFEQITAPPQLVHADILIWSKGSDGKDSSIADPGIPAGDGKGVNKDNVKNW